MQKKIIILILAIAVIGIVFFVVKNGDKATEAQNSGNQTENNQEELPMSIAQISADKIEVVHFHATQQCWSCITVGKYALKTIKEKFPDEYKNGKIVFKDINGELPENRDIVIKYQTRGASLFVNAITNEKDNIEEDTTVWRLVSNESQFINYFENKLKKLLGK